MSFPTGYSVVSYGGMITNEPRMSAYAEALRRAVFPGCTVFDIGAGTGIFSLLAAMYGAGSVVAIEPSDAIELLRETARANGFDDRITIVQDISTNFFPERKADIVVSDIRGILPLFEGHIETIKDARERLLVPGGVLIPARDQLKISIVNYPEGQRSRAEPWLDNKFSLDLSAGYRFAVNANEKANLDTGSLLSLPVDLGELDYRNILDPGFNRQVTLEARANGEAHGLLVWFDCELSEDIGFSNAPGEPQLVYGQTFFPFEQPLDLSTGDRLEVQFRADLADGEYVWSWNSKLHRAGPSDVSAEFRQSTFLGRVQSAESLRRRAPSYIPKPNRDVAIDLFILSQIEGERSQGEIAKATLEEFPADLRNEIDVLKRVADLSRRYRL